MPDFASFTVTGSQSSMAQQVARRESDRNQHRIIGITVTPPDFKDVNGSLEFVCDVRVGEYETWEIVKDVLVAQEAAGLVTDMNVPVTMERSVAGRLTIIARSQVMLPDIRLDRYTYDELDFVFMTMLEEDSEGVWRNGFGYRMTDPTGQTGSSETCRFENKFVKWEDYVYDTPANDGTKWGEVTVDKICE